MEDTKEADDITSYTFPRADNAFEQYRTIVQETSHISDQRHNVGNIFLSVNGILLGAAALVFQQIVQYTATNPLSLPMLLMPILLVVGGFVLCRQWHKLLDNYIKVLTFRYGYHRALEDRFELIPINIDQTRAREKRGVADFTAIERGIPRLFMAIYSAIFVGLLIFGIPALHLIK